MSWDGLLAVLVFLNIALSGCVFIIAKQIRELRLQLSSIQAACVVAAEDLERDLYE